MMPAEKDRRDLNTLLQAEKDRLDKERQERQECMARDEQLLQELQDRLRNVEGLLGTNEAAGMASPEATNTVGRSLTDITEEILSERNGEPMYYKDLAREVQRRGGNLTGQNAANILVARLVNDERFVRPKRKGHYALRSEHPGAKNVGARKRDATVPRDTDENPF